MPDLGIYAHDPRVKVRSDDLIDTTHGPKLSLNHPDGNVWTVTIPDQTDAQYVGPLLGALRYVLGTRQKVGAVGFGQWLHTDGREYAHDPATSGMRAADRLRIGDVIDWAGFVPMEVIADAKIETFGASQPTMAYPVKLPDGEVKSYGYRNGDMVPVRFQD